MTNSKHAIEGAYLELMLLMASVDGKIRDEEVSRIEGNLANWSEFDAIAPKLRHVMLKNMREHVADSRPMESLDEVAQLITHRSHRLRCIRMAFSVLMADGHAYGKELQYLESIRKAFELSKEDIRHFQVPEDYVRPRFEAWLEHEKNSILSSKGVVKMRAHRNPALKLWVHLHEAIVNKDLAPKTWSPEQVKRLRARTRRGARPQEMIREPREAEGTYSATFEHLLSSGAGTFEVTAEAIDVAGNKNVQTVSYRVELAE